MKTLTILLMLFAGVSFAQVGESKETANFEIIGVADRGVGLPKLEVTKVDNTDMFIISYYNLEYPSIKEIDLLTFYATNEDIEYLYSFLKDQLNNKQSKTLELGDKRIMVSKVSSSVRIDVLGGHYTSWFYLSKKQIDRLFNKA